MKESATTEASVSWLSFLVSISFMALIPSINKRLTNDHPNWMELRILSRFPSDNFILVVENVSSVCTYRRCKMRKIQMNYRYLSTGSRIKVNFVFLGGLKRY